MQLHPPLYYREIVDRMSNRLFEKQELINEIDEIIAQEYGDEHSVYSVCAKAASVFKTIESLSDEDVIDWDYALEEYADEVVDHLLSGDRMDTLDMVSYATASGRNLR